MAPTSIHAARAQLATKRAQREGDSNFGSQSDFMDLQDTGPDTIMDRDTGFSDTIMERVTGLTHEVPNNVAKIITDTPDMSPLKIEPLDKTRLIPGESIISIIINEDMADNRFLDLRFIRYSSARPNNELLQLKDDESGTIYVWNGKNQSDGNILLIKGIKGENGQMQYKEENIIGNENIRLTFIHAKY